MPELDRTPVMDWVAACQPGLLAWTREPVRAIEDDEAVHLALVELGLGLDAPMLDGGGLQAAMSGTDAPRDLRTILAQLGPARLLRMVCWLAAEGSPERATVLRLLLDGPHPDATALRSALDVLNRRELLARIFSEERLQQLLAATKTATGGAQA